MQFRSLVIVGGRIFGINHCYSTLYKSVVRSLGDAKLIPKIQFFDIPQKRKHPGGVSLTAEDLKQIKRYEDQAQPATTTEICNFLKANKDKL